MLFNSVYLEKNFITLFIIIVLLQLANTEFFTAIADVEKLLHTEEEIVKSLEKYLQLEEIRITQLKRLKKMYTDLHKLANQDPEAFLSNPVNAFLLVKRLTTDWDTANFLIKNADSQSDLYNAINQPGIIFPEYEDLNGAAVALMRLQSIYQLDTSSIAKGLLKDAMASSPLNAADCFELGKQAYNVGYLKYTLMWMQESLNRLENEEIPTVSKIDVLEYMAYSAYDTGNFSLGMNLTTKITELDPKYPRLHSNLQYYLLKLNEWENLQIAKQNASNATDETDSNPVIDIHGENWKEKKIIERYHRLCRGENLKGPEERNNEFCYFSNQNNNYFKLQPVKVEVLSSDPRIVVFHDVISEKEMNLMKTIAMPELQRAVVQDTNTGNIEYTTDRISKSAVLLDEDHELLSKLSKRIEDISGLTTQSAEPIHIINYGIGGHYDPHFDFAQVADKIEMFRERGNRIATWIFYMSDIPAGGSTVFPIIGVEVKPVKGAAGFWYNMHSSGEGDKRTMHAACPVLVGSKWVGNKWLHEFGNEFKRPCSLNSTIPFGAEKFKKML